jgi:hypothetical protein
LLESIFLSINPIFLSFSHLRGLLTISLLLFQQVITLNAFKGGEFSLVGFLAENRGNRSAGGAGVQPALGGSWVKGGQQCLNYVPF